MDDPKKLFILLIALVLLSAFFSCSETAMMALNRYRLRHQARKGNLTAKRVVKLLDRPDRLLGIVLLGNTFANVMASSVVTMLTLHYFKADELSLLMATLMLTFVLLIFAETAPKTFAVLHPFKVAFAVSWILQVLLFIVYPFVWIMNLLSNSCLRLFGVKITKRYFEPLSKEELRTLVYDQHMLLRVLDLEKVTVEDVMVPRNEIYGIDLNDDWSTILNRLRRAEHSQLPLYEETIDNVKGILKLRKLIEIPHDTLTKKTLLNYADEVYFVPEAALLNRQLINFQNEGQHLGLVLDEYGEIQGLVTLQDVLEEIVGEFSEDEDSPTKMVRPQRDGSVIVDGTITLRELNRLTQWHLPLEGPKTLSGLITQYLEMIPQSGGVACRIHDYPMEVIKANEHTIQLVQVWPTLRSLKNNREDQSF